MPTSTSALPGTTILNLPIAVAVDGSEWTPIVQGGTTKRAQTGDISGILTNIPLILATSAPAGFAQARQLTTQGLLATTDGGASSNFTISLGSSGLSVIGTPSTANSTSVGNISGTANQVLRVSSAGSSLAFGQVNLASSDAVSNVLGVNFGGTGSSNFTQYQLIAGGSVSSAPFQSVTTGTSGFILTYVSSSALPTWQANAASGTVVPGTAYQVAYYSSNGTSIAGSSFFSISSGSNAATITSTLNAGAFFNVANTSTGASAYAGHAVLSANGAGNFAVGGPGLGNAVLVDRVYVDAVATLSGIAINNEGANPIVFGINSSEVARVSSVGRLTLDFPLILATSLGGNTTTIIPGTATVTLTGPQTTTTLIGRDTVDTLTGKTFDTAGSSNVFRINGTAITAVTGSSNVVLGSTPTISGAQISSGTISAPQPVGTWTSTGTWTLGPITLAGAVAGGGQTISNIVISGTTILLATINSPIISNAAPVGTWTSTGTWTLGAFTLGGTVTGTGQTINSVILNNAAPVGTWTSTGTWTLGAHTLGGTVSGGANQINNVVIGAVTPLAGTFTTITSSVHNSTSAIFFQTGGAQAGLISSGQFWVIGSATITGQSSNQILTVSKNTATTLPSTRAPASALPTMILAGEDNSGANFDIMCFGSSASALAGVRYLQSRGTAAAPAALTSPDGVFANFGYGYASDGTYYAVTGFVGTALEAYSSTAHGARLDLYATPTGTATLSIGVSVGSALMVGTTTDGSVGQIIMNSSTFLMRTKTSWANGSSAQTATLLNAPTSSNPTKWIPVDDNGTTRFIPAW